MNVFTTTYVVVGLYVYVHNNIPSIKDQDQNPITTMFNI